MATDVVISYAHADREHASRLAELLAGRGLVVWWDDKLEPGSRVRQAIGAEIEAARKVVVLWSEHSLESDYVLKEAEYAEELKKLISCTLTKVSLPFGFRHLHAVSIKTWEADFQKLLGALGVASAMDPPTATSRPRLEGSASLPPLPPDAAQDGGLRSWISRLLKPATPIANPDVERGLKLLEQGQWAAAHEALSLAIAAASSGAATAELGLVYQKRAEALAQLRRWPACVEDCKQAFRLAPADSTQSLMLGAAACIELAQWQDAIGWCDAAIERNATLVEAYYWRGYARVQNRALDAALADADMALRLNNNLAQAHWLRGTVLIEQAKPEEAIRSLSAAMGRFPTLAHMHHARALAHAHLGGWPEAGKGCTRALELAPNLAEAYWLRGFAKVQHVNRDLDGGADDFAAAIARRPDDENAIHALLWTRAQQANWLTVVDLSGSLLQSAIAFSKDFAPHLQEHEIEERILSPRVRTLRAEAYRMLQEWDPCIADCTEVLSANPGFVDALRIRGLAFLQRNEIDRNARHFENAQQDFKRAISIDSRDATSLCYSGHIKSRRHDHVGALADLDKAIESAPHLALAYYHRAWTHLAIADAPKAPAIHLDLAEKDFQKLVDEARQSGEGYAGLAEVARRRKQPDAALNHLAKAQGVERGLLQTHITYGWVYAERRSWTEATSNFEEALRRDPSSQYALFGLGECARAQRHWHDAVKYYDAALRQDPDLLPAYEMRAAVNVELVNHADAINDYGKAIARASARGLHDAVGEYRSQRAWAYFELGDDAAGLEEIRIAADLAPGSEAVLQNWGNLLGFMGRWDEALAKLDACVELHPQSASAWESRGIALGYLRSFDRAKSDLDKAIALDGTVGQRFSTRAWISNMKQDWPAAVADGDRACALDARIEFAYANRSIALWWSDKHEAAARDLAHILQLAVDDDARAEPKRSRMLTCAWRNMAQVWSLALTKRPDDVVARFGWSVAQWMAGDSGSRPALPQITA